MDFSLAEERRLLQDTIRRFLANEYAFDKRRARLAAAEGFSRETWKQLARPGARSASRCAKTTAAWAATPSTR